MPTLHPKTLKELRETQALTQQALAERSRVSVKQISRLEHGDTAHKAHGATVAKLSRVLGVSPGTLAEEPGKRAAQERRELREYYSEIAEEKADRKIAAARDADEKKRIADEKKRVFERRQKVSFPTSDEDMLEWDFISDRYNVSNQAIFNLAPLMFALVAEMSLKARRERLKTLESGAEAMWQALPRGLPGPALEGVVPDRATFAAYMAAEQASIEARDVDGGIVEEHLASAGIGKQPHGEGGLECFLPFELYYTELAREFGMGAPQSHQDELYFPLSNVLWWEVLNLHWQEDGPYSALASGTVRIHDIPKDLRAPEREREMLTWLSDQWEREWERRQKVEKAERAEKDARAKAEKDAMAADIENYLKRLKPAEEEAGPVSTEATDSGAPVGART